MSIFSRLFLLGFWFFMAVGTVSAIKCYMCKSDTHPNCASGNQTLLELFKIDCVDVESMSAIAQTHGGRTFSRCAKTFLKGITTRTCFYPENDLDNTCKEVKGVYACLCSTDYCNSANGQHYLAFTSLIILIVSMTSWKWL